MIVWKIKFKKELRLVTPNIVMILFFNFRKHLMADDETELFFFQFKSPLILIKLYSTFSFPKEILEILWYKLNADCFKAINW